VQAKPIHRVALLAAGGPDKPTPDFDRIARDSRARAQLASRPVRIYAASRRARIALGASPEGGWGPVHALSHSLGVSATYFHLKRTAPELAALWVCEEEFGPAGFREAQPDALLREPDGKTVGAIEFALDYPTERFERLHATLMEQQLDYFIYGVAP
jgi:hypothetical protein